MSASPSAADRARPPGSAQKARYGRTCAVPARSRRPKPPRSPRARPPAAPRPAPPSGSADASPSRPARGRPAGCGRAGGGGRAAFGATGRLRVRRGSGCPASAHVRRKTAGRLRRAHATGSRAAARRSGAPPRGGSGRPRRRTLREGTGPGSPSETSRPAAPRPAPRRPTRARSHDRPAFSPCRRRPGRAPKGRQRLEACRLAGAVLAREDGPRFVQVRLELRPEPGWRDGMGRRGGQPVGQGGVLASGRAASRGPGGGWRLADRSTRSCGGFTPQPVASAAVARYRRPAGVVPHARHVENAPRGGAARAY